MEGNILILITTSILILLYIGKSSLNHFRIDILDPLVHFILFYLLFFTWNALFMYRFELLTGLISMVGSISFFIGYISCNKSVKMRKSMSFSIKKDKGLLNLLYALIIVRFLVFLVKIKTSGFTLTTYLLNMLAFHAEHGKAGGYVWNLIEIPLFAVFFTFLIIYSKKGKENLFKSVLLYVLFSFAGLSQSRWGYIQAAFLFPLFINRIFYSNQNMISIRKVIFLIAIIPVLLIGNNLRNGYSFNAGFEQSKILQNQIKGDTQPSRNLDKLLSNEKFDYNFGKYLPLQVVSLVPRVLWSEKPYTSMLYHLTQQYFLIDPIKDGVTLTFTIFDFFTIFGFLSLISGMILIGYLLKYIYLNLMTGKLYFLVMYMPIFMNLINYFRGGVLDLLALLTTQLVLTHMTFKLTSKIFGIKTIIL